MGEHQLSRLLRGETEALSQTGQLEHAGNMLNVRRACSLVLLFTVVGFVRQTQTRLVQEERVILRVLRVVAGVPGEQLRQARTRQQRQGYSQVGGGCRVQDRGDFLQQRLQAVRLNLLNIHEGVVQRADAGLRLLLRDLLHQLTHVLLCVIAEGVQAAVLGAVRRDFVGGKPLTVDVAEEIVARLDGFIHPFFSDSRVSSHGSILCSYARKPQDARHRAGWWLTGTGAHQRHLGAPQRGIWGVGGVCPLQRFQGCRKPARTVQKKNRTGGPVIYPQKLGIQSVRIPARSRTAATCRRLPRANHHPVNPQQVAEPIGAS